MGEVIWHSLTEDGQVEIVDIKFGNKTYENVSVKHLNPVSEKSHGHPRKKKPKKETIDFRKTYKRIGGK